MNDKLIRGLSFNNKIRFFALDCTNVIKEMQNIHNLSITTTIALGRLTCAALMLSPLIKTSNGKITLKIDADGPIGNLISTVDIKAQVKSYIINPQSEIAENKTFNIAKAIGKGFLTIIKDLGNQKPYSGKVALQTSEIGEDLAYYFLQSEQIPSAVSLGVLVDKDGLVRKAGGYILQVMPDTEEEIIDILEKNIQNTPNFTDLLDMNLDIEQILQKYLLPQMTIMQTLQPKYFCNCHKERFQKGLALLPKNELEEIIADNEAIKIKCNFCNKEYVFSIPEIKNILNEKN